MRTAFLIIVALLAGGCSRPAPAPARRTDGQTTGSESARSTASTAAALSTLLPPAPVWNEAMDEVAAGADRFACDLYGRLREKPGNLFFSPASIHTALAMTSTGARGATLDEMVAVLHLPESADTRLAAGDLGRFYSQANSPSELAVANALWGQAGLAWESDFRTSLAERFGAGFEETDFAGHAEDARQRINAWVAERTRSRIQNLLPPGAVSDLTRLCLASAIAFKGTWAGQFDAAATSPQPFRLAGGSSVEIPLMHRRGRYDHALLDGFQLLALPYEGHDLEMVVLLPREPDGLAAIEDRFTAETLEEWRRAAAVADVDLWLPRFRLDDRFEPVRELEALGMRACFAPGAADLTGMTTTERLSVSRVIHQAFVAVDEEGTEAAAATAVIANAPAPPPPKPVEFRADRPFVFLIRDAHHGTILFLGRLSEPKQ